MQEISKMKIFLKVIDLGSFSEAGRQLGVAPSSVSRHISSLEASLQVRLIQRNTHNISLTEAGQVYYQRVQRIIEDIDDTHAVLGQLQDGPRGTLRLNLNIEYGSQYVVNHIPEFLALYPDIKIDLVMNDKIVDLLEQEADLALRYGKMEDSNLISRRVAGTSQLILGGSPEYFEKYGIPLVPEDLLNHNCITYKFPQGQTWYLRKGNKTHEVKVSGNMQSNSGFAIRQALKSSVGITIMPKWLADDALKSKHIVTALDDYQLFQGTLQERSIYLVYPAKKFLPLKVRVFIDFLIEKFELTTE